MNPHFIFNVMNSIRIFMQNHDLKSAEKYLTKFSKQVRYVLDNSDKQIVSLENELNSLRNYTELEMQQFENGFDFKIDCEAGVHVSDYELPSLLLQPFVENAIKHGISRMKSGGKIHIDICRKGENLLIAIEDNGIGMKEAIEWNEQNREPHESRGTKIIFQRIEAYNKFFRKNIRAEIRDLRSETGTISGTRVEIEI
jgi:LytS/YehU family sensor histidine kinase